MKKAISLLLALALCLSLCACGDGKAEPTTANEIDKSESSNYVGVWESEHMRFTVNKGGIGRYEQPGTDIGFFDFTWEVKDEVLVIFITGQVSEYKASFELSDDGTSLTILHNGLPGYTEGETAYEKQ